MKLCLLVFFVVFSQIQLDNVCAGKKYVSNLSPLCLKCLCQASSFCNINVGCQGEYCGPFQIKKDYWRDAGRPTVKDDDADKANAYSNCMKDYNCSATTVENYMGKYGYDCDGSGVTDCDDFARLHFHLKDKCHLAIASLNYGKRYEQCRPISYFPGENRK